MNAKIELEINETINVDFRYDIGTRSFSFFNAEMRQKFGLQPAMSLEAVLAKVHPEDMVFLERDLNAFIAGEIQGSAQFRLLMTDTEAWIRVTPFIVSAEIPVIFGNAVDTTSEVNNFNSIRKYANKKNSMLHIIAHDLRGPLGVAKSLTEVMGIETDPIKLQRMVHSIQVIVDQSISLITDLVNREYLDTLNVDLYRVKMDVVIKVREYIEECSLSAVAAKRKFSFTCAQPEIFAEIDEAKFMQILNNLMTNALKFTHPGGHIQVSVAEKDDRVIISVKDDGIGIPTEWQDILFDKFTKARRVGLNGEPTVGLGLSIIKAIVDWHDGQVRVESVEGKGTTFYVSLPLMASAQ